MEKPQVETDNRILKIQEMSSNRKEAIVKEENVKGNPSNLEQANVRKEAPVGILRLDNSGKRRVPLELNLLQGEPPSPQPSIDRLSVTFAEDSVRSDNTTKLNLNNPNTCATQNVDKMLPTSDVEESDEEDYSASVNAIIQRKASTRRSRRRSKRRASSPFSPDILPGADGGRRRSSVFTTSSGDTAITIDESLAPELTQDQIFENIRLHKEVLSNMKMQPWNMRRKLKLVMQAKSYVKRHEGALQERFTKTHSLTNMLARWNIYLIKKWQHYRREMANLSNFLIPWERRIKEIESHFGSVVASYFIFLRWLFWVNIVISGVLIAFVAVPEIVITASSNTDIERKRILPEDKYNATNFVTLWDFEGVLKYTPLFYGWYTNKDDAHTGYRLPLAYFMTELVVYVYSFVVTLKKMAENSRMSKLSEKDDECTFTWKLFTGWDYMIGNAETAHNRVMSIVMSFKEALLEEAEKNRKERNWKIIWTRVFVNLTVLGLFALSAAAVVVVVKRSTEPEATSNIWRRNETTVVMTLISFIFPAILEILGFMEQYHPRKQLRVQLARIMLLNLLNLYSLIFAQFDKINDMTGDLLNFKPNVTPIPVDPLSSNELDLTTISTTTIKFALPEINVTHCEIICSNITGLETFNLTEVIAAVATTVAATAFPKFLTSFSPSTLNDTIYPNETLTNNSSYLDLNDCCENITDFNKSSGTVNFNNGEEGFVDYLSYILESLNDTFALNNTDALNSTYNNSTMFVPENSTYEYFKTTLATKYNTSEDEMETIYNAITNTMESTPGQAIEKCEEICNVTSTILFSTLQEHQSTIPTPTADILDSSSWSYQNRSLLRSLCWETMFGQELVKLTVLDFVFTVIGTIGIDFLRGVFVRIMNRCWCWDLEKKFPEYGEFKVAENILHLVNNQGMVWMGMFFSPGLVVLNVVKLILLMYLRSWAVLTCNVPHAVIFRASRSNNFYFALLLTMLFLCVLPVGYAIVWVEPSWHCGPFSYNFRIFDVLTRAIRKLVPTTLHRALEYIVSPGIVIPLLVLLILIIYYLISLTNSLREANSDLKIQLRQERTEERRKLFQIADRRRRGGSGGSGDLENTPFAKWKKLIGTLPRGKSSEDNSKQPSTPKKNIVAKPDTRKTKDLVTKFIRRALRKPSLHSEEDATDNEQPESLPDDIINHSRLGKGKLLLKLNMDSSETKHVQINEEVSEVFRKNREEEMPNDQNNSPSHSSGSKVTREDSAASNWSDNVPVITISKTESCECILAPNTVQITEQEGNEDDPKVFVRVDEDVSKIRHALRKQEEIVEYEVNEGNGEETEEESTETTVKSQIDRE